MGWGLVEWGLVSLYILTPLFLALLIDRFRIWLGTRKDLDQDGGEHGN